METLTQALGSNVEALLAIAQRKSDIDQSSDWFQGAQTYLHEIQSELQEVEEEIPHERRCYLEEELGDVLWDYLNLLLALEKESEIKLESVIARACKKYEQRISAIEQGIGWDEVKAQQKVALQTEQQAWNAYKAPVLDEQNS
ncbi:nucleotide pyrophosphohydrolase [Vibrio fluvialis]|nr:nucleotide pyrophosphohydrolase [Vibrio fluvialis]EKO3436420.1 nucleotide pyrophosphohydrolase [Vibrio fluvialis]EKO3548592.1 nucleotide pyrophosphohydrolase [Vibrio fluvialis]ELW1728323.1 nucleotide pyrophosphohydrolase [Vibrio fluvialis]